MRREGGEGEREKQMREEKEGEKGEVTGCPSQTPFPPQREPCAPPFPPPYTPSRQKQLFLVECSVVVRVCGGEEWREGV